jgi:hypothetical protein
MKKIFLLCGIILLTAFINNAKALDTYYTVVISSVKSAQSAQNLANDMIKKGFEANVMLVTLSNGNTNRVCIGKSSTKEGAQDIQKKLAKAGYSSSWITVVNEPSEQKAVVRKYTEREPADEMETYTIDVVTTAPIEKKEKVAEKKSAIVTQNPKSAIPTPPDVDKLPLAVPKEFTGNKSNMNSAETSENDVVVYNVTTTRIDDKPVEVKVYEFYTEGNQPISDERSTVTFSNPSEVVIYSVGVGNQPINTSTTSIITTTEDTQIVTSDILTTTSDITLSPSNVSITEYTTEAEPAVISNDVLITRNEPFPIRTNASDSLVILTAAPEAQIIQSQRLDNSITTDNLTFATSSSAVSVVSVKTAETEENPKMESLIPGTNLTYNQFYTEIKKVFYALEKYSLASGTLLNEYIDPTYGTYIRFRDNDKVGFEKMIKPKDIYKNPQVKSNVLMFFQDMVKVRRQPPVIEQLPQYDCALKHIPGLNIYLSSLAKDNKFYDETVKYLKSTGINPTSEEIATILTANNTINAAFAIGSSELVKAVYFAVEGEKVYLRYIDMYDNCEKK